MDIISRSARENHRLCLSLKGQQEAVSSPSLRAAPEPEKWLRQNRSAHRMKLVGDSLRKQQAPKTVGRVSPCSRERGFLSGGSEISKGHDPDATLGTEPRLLTEPNGPPPQPAPELTGKPESGPG